MSQIPETHVDIIQKSQVVILATNGSKGAPQVTALWFLYEDGVLRFSLNNSRQKTKNLLRDNRASAFFIDPENPYRTIELRGTASVEPDAEYAFADKVGAKYGADLHDMDGPGESRSVVTFNPEKVLVFGQ